MAAFDNNKQKMVPLNGVRQELGGNVTIAGVSGQDFTVATKLRRVIAGICTMEADGMVAIVTTGKISDGQVAMKRLGPISTSADTVSYTLFGH